MVAATKPLDRRRFLIGMGHGAFAIAVFGVAACGSGTSPSPSRSATPSSSASGGPNPSGSGDASPTAPPAAVAWSRVDLGFVSAYILTRDGVAALVDTGVAGSADAIDASLKAIKLGWSDVGHVILTHLHTDHVGSAPEVLERAPKAIGYAGSPDIATIPVPRPLTTVADGDEVFGLRVVGTPGHTPGHISLYDPVGGLFVAGDALNTVDGKVTGPNPQFSMDMKTANELVKTIAALEFGTLLVGHGAPITKGASAMVTKLAASL